MTKSLDLPVASVDPLSRITEIQDRGDEGYAQVNSETEKRVVRKVDLFVIPVLWFLFLVSFIDRGNIGNAAIAGMREELKLTGNKYNVAVQLFTVAYVAFGLPANIVFKKTGPKSLAVMMFLWGAYDHFLGRREFAFTAMHYNTNRT